MFLFWDPKQNSSCVTRLILAPFKSYPRRWCNNEHPVAFVTFLRFPSQILVYTSPYSFTQGSLHYFFKNRLFFLFLLYCYTTKRSYQLTHTYFCHSLSSEWVGKTYSSPQSHELSNIGEAITDHAITVWWTKELTPWWTLPACRQKIVV